MGSTKLDLSIPHPGYGEQDPRDWWRGLVVAVSSIAGLAPLYGLTGYSAAKHAIHGLFESLRCELRDDGVEVLTGGPGAASPSAPWNR
jgi:NAD(P)-dependent dehydrogenase (short-subunit alcohol dehydrogenase family)